MANITTSSTSSQNHFIDILEVVSPRKEEEEQRTTTTNKTLHKHSSRPIKLHFMRKQSQPNISRQVSLETGVSVLGRDSKNERKLLSSGLSFGGFGTSFENVTEGRKGDFNLFRTKSTLGKQNSMLPVRVENDPTDSQRPDEQGGRDQECVKKSVPAGRYFAALRGPELDQVKEYEDILLPKDETWPFLLRFPIGCFGMCLGLSSQAILWRNLATSKATRFLHVTPLINLCLWHLALVVLVLMFFTYALKCIFYFEAVRREYYHPVRVNFFFAPWIVCMFLAIGAPPTLVPGRLHPAIWCVFMTPVIILELKIYGQWLSGGKRRLCKVANPSTHLSVVGNFVGAILAAKVGWLEPAKFLWAVGFAHYMVVFVTLYQRLPTTEALPKELHPVYSMFIAAPSAASIAWGNIYSEYDGLSRTCFFIALFLYVSLVVRINFFWGFKFSIAWWSYTFPMTTISLASILYAEHVPSIETKILALTLSFMSTTMVTLLFFSTILHAFVWQTLFPNDLAIAITKKRNINANKQLDRDRKSFKRPVDIKRWTKQSPFSFVSSMNKKSSEGKELGDENV